MRRAEDLPLDPEFEAALGAIDASLVGEPVEPRHAEFAELALLLRDERPVIPWEMAAGLDQRVERRFAPSSPGRLTRQSGPRRRWPWVWAPATALVAALAVAVVIVAGSGNGSSSSEPPSSSAPASHQRALVPAPSFSQKSAHVPAPPRAEAKLLSNAMRPASSTAASSAAAQSAPQFAPAGPGAPAALQPPSAGRKVTRGGQLQLSTRPKQIDQVAQELFDVVGQEQGVVQSSNVTAGGSGYAQFQLSIPTSRLTQTMTSLSTLPHTRVQSRTDTSQDVTNSYQADQRRLADARALRVSLLKQLAAATTQGEIDSLTARLHSTEAAISSDENTLHSLQHRIAYSQVNVTINGGIRPVPIRHSSGFTLGRATHDAGHVLTVAAGVALIALAALIPAALLVALGWWIWAAVRQRRRRQALDVI